MKVFISADIEGVVGTTTWTEARKREPAYAEFQRQMNREVAAACEGALAGGATEIVVKDAHGGADNLIGSELPVPAQLVRAWSGHPFAMVQELDASFACVLFVGYHARAGSGGNPLAHTLSSARVHQIRINERPASEFYIHYLAAGLVNVPVVLLSGDEAICSEVTDTDSQIETVAVKTGHGASTINLHPEQAIERIREASQRAVMGHKAVAAAQVPANNVLQVVFKEQAVAYQRSHYPGAKLRDPYTVEVATEDYYEILRALIFLV